MPKKIIRVTGRNGVVYEERMTEEDFALFLQLVGHAANTLAMKGGKRVD